ncbi:MAG: GNAT family N-acetyltransferase [Rhodobacteraceae bacterium CG17_big_fil_post_rev_8_21_14_2_50_63_15]|nr:GNAT family N-acetyltransferase [Roseovarius sp.]PIV79463.1 MAG: GNAT family N-acetyltransferase [Rhodobacteraceae bacterium CG17_big_fil_post_rev_8_21_14_2_50_63_15]
MKVVRGHLWHVPRLAAILWAFSRATPWLPIVRSRSEDLRTLCAVVVKGWVRVVRDPQGVAAFSVCDGAILHALYVHPLRWRQGLGRLLLTQAKSEAPALQLWVLEANLAARQFYLREGFVEVEHGEGMGNDEGLPDIRMIWRNRGSGA